MKILLNFDLDFTLIDNREGIVNSFNYVLKKNNIAAVEKVIIDKMIDVFLNKSSPIFIKSDNFR